MNRQRRFALMFVFGLLLTAFCLLPSAFGQSTSATLSGTVTDQNGAVVSGVEISVRNPATGAERTATTSDEGYFTIPLLPPGNYTITARREGFSAVKIPDLVLNVGDQKALKIELKAGDVNATVVVDSSADTVRTDGSVGTVLDRNSSPQTVQCHFQSPAHSEAVARLDMVDMLGPLVSAMPP